MPLTQDKAPKVSVILTSYNHGSFLQEAIESVLHQTFEDFELIIWDDASTDNSWEIISSYTDARIRSHRNLSNKGPTYGVNKAIFEIAKGKYIALHHSDDIWASTKLKIQVEYLDKNPDIGAVFSNALAINENGFPFQEGSHFYSSIFQQNNRSRHEWLRHFFFYGNALCHPSILINKKCYDKCGGYDDRLAQLPDFDMWIRLLFKYDIHILQEKLVRFRVRNNEANTSGNRPDTRIRNSFEYFTLLKRYLQIANFTELSAIFPEIQTLHTKDKGEISFLLGRVALQGASHPMAQLFALQLIHDALGDDSRRKIIESQYGFTCIDLINLTSKYDVFGIEARNLIPNIQHIIADRDAKIAQRDELLEKLKIALQDRNDLLNKTLDQLKEIQEEAQILIEEKTNKEEINNITNLHCATQEQYQRWRALHQPIQADIDFYRSLIEQEETLPTFHIIVPMTTGDEPSLADTIDSIGNQIYPNWKFTVVADYDSPDPLFEEIEQLSWFSLEDIETGIKKATHEIKAELVGLIPPGTTFDALFLAKAYLYSKNNNQIKAIYFDNDERDNDGLTKNPKFKPDFNFDYLLSANYIGDICIFKYTPHLFNNLAKFQCNIILQTTLDIYTNFKSQSILHIDEILCSSYKIKELSIKEKEERKEIILSYFDKNRINATIHDGTIDDTFLINYNHRENPKVSIIIPTKNSAKLIKSCIDSIYNKTSYQNFETIIIDNQSSDPTTLAYLETIAVVHPTIRVIKYNYPFNFSAMNNFAVQQAGGEYLVLLNDDTEIIQDNWLERMLQHAQRKEVGAVGAKLVFLNKTIQHAGVVLGITESADHPGIGQDMLADGYMNRLQVTQNFSAVTAACLMVSKQKYLQVGGMDEQKFKILYNDVDFCLKLGQAGYLNVWTPHATVIHHGSSSLGKKKTKEEIEKARKRADGERVALRERWSPLLCRDPHYNRNLSLRDRNWALDTVYTAPWSTLQPDRLRVAALPNTSEGSTHYRVTAPLQGIRDQGWAWNAVFPDSNKNPANTMPSLIELARLQADTFLLHSVLPNMETLRQHKKQSKVFLVFGADDLLTQVPKYNPTSKTVPHNINSILKNLLKECDRLIVSTEPLFDFYRKKKLIDDLVLIPNSIDSYLWGSVTSSKRQGPKPRVGWAGAAQHHGDLQLIQEVVQKTANEVHWIFLGMCPEAIRPYVHEFHPAVPLPEYPSKLASLNLDLAVAPLENNLFNEAKSNLRLLEYGMLGIPVVASDVFPYQNSPAKLVTNTDAEWVAAIIERIRDLPAAEQEGLALQQWVKERFLLEHHLPSWLEALTPRQSARSSG